MRTQHCITTSVFAAGLLTALVVIGGCGGEGVAAGPGAADAPGASDAPGGDAPGRTAPRKLDGSVLYDRYCQSCHGDNGQGDGPGALILTIKPRDFSQGIFKFKTTTGMPTDDDLVRTISRGVPGTEMAAYHGLPEAAKRALAAHVKSLTVGRLEIDDKEELAELGAVGSVEEDGKLYALINWFKRRPTGNTITVPPPPDTTPEMIALGKKLFSDPTAGGCSKCHGETGIGDGPSAVDLKDDWGYPIKPRNLTSDPFKGGSELQDIYRRIVMGIPGTPMPTSVKLLPTERERWAVAMYVLQLAEGEPHK